MRASSFLAKKGLQGKFQNRNMNGNNKVFQTREKMMKRYLDFPFLRGYDRSWRVSAPTNKEKNYKDFILKFIRKLEAAKTNEDYTDQTPALGVCWRCPPGWFRGASERQKHHGWVGWLQLAPRKVPLNSRCTRG